MAGYIDATEPEALTRVKSRRTSENIRYSLRTKDEAAAGNLHKEKSPPSTASPTQRLSNDRVPDRRREDYISSMWNIVEPWRQHKKACSSSNLCKYGSPPPLPTKTNYLFPHMNCMLKPTKKNNMSGIWPPPRPLSSKQPQEEAFMPPILVDWKCCATFSTIIAAVRAEPPHATASAGSARRPSGAAARLGRETPCGETAKVTQTSWAVRLADVGSGFVLGVLRTA